MHFVCWIFDCCDIFSGGMYGSIGKIRTLPCVSAKHDCSHRSALCQEFRARNGEEEWYDVGEKVCLSEFQKRIDDRIEAAKNRLLAGVAW